MIASFMLLLLPYLLQLFICYKSDNEVACKVSSENLTKIGFMYGNILAYHQIFKKSENNITTKEQIAAELKSRLKRSLTIRMRKKEKTNQGARNIKSSF